MKSSSQTPVQGNNIFRFIQHSDLEVVFLVLTDPIVNQPVVDFTRGFGCNGNLIFTRGQENADADKQGCKNKPGIHKINLPRNKIVRCFHGKPINSHFGQKIP